MTTFDALKKNRGNLNQMMDAVNAMTNRGREEDPNLWKLHIDQEGNGHATIRFMPPPPNETVPFVRYFSYAFKGPTGKWYFNNSLTSIGQRDPVAELNNRQWATNDPAHPENEGKVFKYRYGNMIYQIISDIINPKFPGDRKLNPFDFWEGANLKLRFSKSSGFYNRTEFDEQSELYGGDDAKLKAIYDQLHPLSELVDPNNTAMYKSYDELKLKLESVLNISAENEPQVIVDPQPAGSVSASTSNTYNGEAVAVNAEPVQVQPQSENYQVEEDKTLDYFKKFASG